MNNKIKIFAKKYVPKKLTKSDKKVVKSELLKSRKFYKKGFYYTRKQVKSYPHKVSPHVIRARKIYKIEDIYASPELAKKTGCSIKSLSEIERKGQKAYYSSGSRPNQTAHSWGRARLASAITGGKSAAVDFKILEKGCDHKRSKAYKMALNAKKKHGFGTRRVPKTK